MTEPVRLVGAAVAAALLVVALIPVAIRVARALDFYDRPVGYKGHGAPTPYLGGAAVVAGTLVAMLAFAGDAARLAPLAACALGLWVVGTVDDWRRLGPGFRVLVTAVAAVILWAADLGWSLPGGTLPDLLVTIVWVVALVNAFNLTDNMDGAAGAVTGAAAVGAVALAVRVDDVALAVAAVSLAGASLGFLRYNAARPARIFLGDGGSMPIGLIVATILMGLRVDHGLGWGALVVAGLMGGVPILDTTLVVWSRRRRSLAVASGARDHLTHRLRTRLPSARIVALVLAATQLTLAALALLASELLSEALLLLLLPVAVIAGVAAIAVLDSPAWTPPAYRDNETMSADLLRAAVAKSRNRLTARLGDR